MRVIIVDDERMAILSMEKLLQDLGQFDIVGTYQNPYEALTRIEAEQPDLVFLDIDMPELNGLELAERIQNVSPQIEIVFATAYDDFAVKAFELHALDYVLKPVQRERLAKTITRISLRMETTSSRSVTESPTLMIRLFQTLEFERRSKQSQAIAVHWRTTKAQELFTYLLQHRQYIVHKDVLLEELWPEMDWKKASTYLYSTVYQIRKMLEVEEINIRIISQEGGYQLELGEVNLDVDLWEKGVSKLLGQRSPSTELLNEQIQLFQLYRGDYLATYNYLWAENERQRLTTLYFHHATQLIELLTLSKRYAEALNIAHRFLSIQPYMEEGYFFLMKLHALLGEPHSVEQQYLRLKEMLEKEYDSQPPENIQAWYDAWKKNH